MQRSLIIGLISALILVVFALKNSAVIEIDFIIGNPVKGSLSLVLILTIMIGIIIGLLLSYPNILKHKKKITEQNSEITKLTNILDEYKKEYGIRNKSSETENKEEKE